MTKRNWWLTNAPRVLIVWTILFFVRLCPTTVYPKFTLANILLS